MITKCDNIYIVYIYVICIGMKCFTSLRQPLSHESEGVCYQLF